MDFPPVINQLSLTLASYMALRGLLNFPRYFDELFMEKSIEKEIATKIFSELKIIYYRRASLFN